MQAQTQSSGAIEASTNALKIGDTVSYVVARAMVRSVAFSVRKGSIKAINGQITSWRGPYANAQCAGVVPRLTRVLTAHNRERHRFVCEAPDDGAQPAKLTLQPRFIHQSFRM